MKNAKQEELCKLIEAFSADKSGENFQKVLNALFGCPLYFPVGKGDKKGQFLMVENQGVKHMAAFSDMEEVKRKEDIGDVDFVPFSLEDYAKVLADATDVKGLIINIFNKENCVINREFFVDVVVPAFEKNSIMPGLEAEDGTQIAMTKIPFVIGRNEKSDLTIDENTINDVHAVILENDGHYYVEDRGSLNGTFVNGKEIPKGEKQEIVHDDVIEFYDKAYTFVPLGLANRQPVFRSIYGDDRAVIANGVFLVQNSLFMQEFFTNTDKFTETIVNDTEKQRFRQFLMMGVEMTCAMKEKEQKIEDENVIKEQRTVMIRKGMTIFDKDDYGFEKAETEGMDIYVAHFPEYLHFQGMAKRMYFVIDAEGAKNVYMVKCEQEKTVLTRVGEDHSETPCGDAPDDKTQELEKIKELAAPQE